MVKSPWLVYNGVGNFLEMDCIELDLGTVFAEVSSQWSYLHCVLGGWGGVGGSVRSESAAKNLFLKSREIPCFRRIRAL